MDENDQFFLAGLEEEVLDVAEEDVYIVSSDPMIQCPAISPILFAGPSGRKRIPF